MAERLTVSGATTQRDIDRLLEVSNCNQFGRNGAYYKLQHYEDLDEQGRLIELPCAVGDTVYSFSFNIVYPFTVNGFEINKDGVEFKGSYCGEEKSLEYWSIRFPVSKIGKAVFLTPEEAEAALKGVENAAR